MTQLEEFELGGSSQPGARRSTRQAEEKETTPATLTGKNAIELYLECFQFVLWKQAHWLVNVKGYPEELEVSLCDHRAQ